MNRTSTSAPDSRALRHDNRVRRILMTTDAVGGVWTYAMQLAKSLAPYDIEITLATMGPPPSEPQREEAARIENLSLIASDYKLEWMDEPWTDVAQAGRWLLNLEQQVSPDMVHLNGYVHAALPWTSPVLVVAHSCVLSWWRAVKRSPLPPQWSQYAERVQRGLHAADVVVAPSQAMASSLIANYGGLPNVEVIYNAANAADFHITEKRPLVFSAGRIWDEAKNIQLLAKAARDIHWPVEVAGDPRGPDGRVADFANVRLLGQITRAEIAAQMAKAAIYVMPARYEPFGLSILEAALSGCALVLGDIPSLREIWGLAAVYVDTDDWQQLSVTVNDVIADSARRHALAHAAQKRALTLTPKRQAEAYLSLYQRLADKGAANQRCFREVSKCAL
jgi:glycogen(starch) synthase